MRVNYDDLANAYAKSRSASNFVVDELLVHCGIDEQSKALEVGCGTADHIAAIVDKTGCHGYGVEPSDGMRSHVPRMDRLRVVGGRAEAIPLDDGLLDVVFTVNVVHHMTDPAAYFCEANRVLKTGAQVCTVTESAAMIRRRRPLAEYWPATVEPEIERYPDVDLLLSQMHDAGFVECIAHEISEAVSVSDVTAYRKKAFSALLLISEADFASGLQQLELDVQRGSVQGLSEYVCLWGTAHSGNC